MRTTVRRSDDRGKVEGGWLKSAHSFSFGDYYDPSNMGFGALRVLNDDHILGGTGFPPHPHRDMEIFTIPLKGSLSHKDSTGTSSTIKPGDIQIMSAGTGVIHSEFNGSETEPTLLLQIWITPHTRNLKPRYDKKHFAFFDDTDKLHTVITPTGNDGALLIYQNANISIGNWTKEDALTYNLFDTQHGVYLLVIEGELMVDGTILKKRDALAITQTDSFDIALTPNTMFLIIEVPLS